MAAIRSQVSDTVYARSINTLLQHPKLLIAIASLLLAIAIGAFQQVKIQLLPEISRPLLLITTSWRAALPQEIEERIIEPQERAIASVPGLVEMISRASVGTGTLTLEFHLNTDMNAAMTNVVGRLNGIEGLPEDSSVSSIEHEYEANSRQTGVSLVYLVSGSKTLSELSNIANNTVIPRLLSIHGVENVREVTPVKRQLAIEVDPHKAAAANIDFSELVESLSQSANESAGFFNKDNVEYAVRFDGSMSPENQSKWIVSKTGTAPIYLRDIATISVKELDRKAFALVNGSRAIALRITQGRDANLLELMDEVHHAVDDLNNMLVNADVRLVRTVDLSQYIRSSLGSLIFGLTLGAVLSSFIVHYAFRSSPITALILVSVPTAVVFAVLTLSIFGKSINLVSLAGIAFAVGIVLDASIVTIDSILHTIKREGISVASTVRGSGRVAAAIAASTVTTVIVFFPVGFRQKSSNTAVRGLGAHDFGVNSRFGLTRFLRSADCVTRYIGPQSSYFIRKTGI